MTLSQNDYTTLYVNLTKEIKYSIITTQRKGGNIYGKN